MQNIPNRPYQKISIRIAVGFLASMLLLLPLAACGQGSGASKESSESGATLTGPDETVKLYRNNCISCHGTELQGMMGESTNLQKVGSAMTKEQIREQIAKGGSLMPAFKDRLDDAQIESLADWLAARK